MTLNFPLNPPLDSIFDPGNGLKYKWDGSQWNQLERTLKTIYPIDLDIGSGTTTVMRDLITFGGSKDFTFVLPKCTYNTISTELLAASAGADPTKLQWKDYSSYDNAGYVYVDKDVPGNNWPNPNPSITPYIYVNSPALGSQLEVEVLGGRNASGWHWYYLVAPNVLDSLVGSDVSMSICDPADIIDEHEFSNDNEYSSYPNFFVYFTFKDNTIGTSELANSDELYATEKLTGLVDTYSIDNVEFIPDGTVRVSVTVKDYNTGYHAYDTGAVFNFSYKTNISSGDAYTHFIDLTTINKI